MTLTNPPMVAESIFFGSPRNIAAMETVYIICYITPKPGATVGHTIAMGILGDSSTPPATNTCVDGEQFVIL